MSKHIITGKISQLLYKGIIDNRSSGNPCQQYVPENVRYNGNVILIFQDKVTFHISICDTLEKPLISE